MRAKYYGTREQQIESLRQSGWKLATMKEAPVVIAWKRDERGWSAKGWSFKAFVCTKPGSQRCGPGNVRT